MGAKDVSSPLQKATRAAAPRCEHVAMIRESFDDGGQDGLSAWLRGVVAPEFGDPVLESPDWRAWLSQLYRIGGAVGASELRAAATTAQRQIAEEACQRVQADLAHTVRSAGPVVSVVAEDFGLRIAYNGELSNYDGGALFSMGLEEAACEMADVAQDEVIEDLLTTWPACTKHDYVFFPGLLPSGAAWVCARGRHSIRIGELAADTPL